MRKILPVFVFLLLFVLSLFGLYWKNQYKPQLSWQEQIAAATCAKFESSEPGSRELLLYQAETKPLADFVYGLDLVECDIPVSDWQYRVIYNCNEICPTCQEIVVLVGDRSLSIDGVLYTSKPELPFKRFWSTSGTNMPTIAKPNRGFRGTFPDEIA